MDEQEALTDNAQMDTVDKGQQAREPFQVAPELMERVEAALGLRDIRRVVFVVGHQQGVVDVGDGNMRLLQLLAKEDVFVAAALETLVETYLQHGRATDEEIGRTERLVGVAAPLGCRVLGGFGLFVQITQVML